MAGRSSRAQNDLHCDYVGFSWTPAGGSHVPKADRTLAGSLFVDYRAPGRFRRRSPERSFTHTVQVTDQGGSWTFDALGPERK